MASVQLKSLISLCQVQILWDFPCFAVSFWDPTLHVFCFGNSKLCPLIEEFGAIVGWPLHGPPVVLRLEVSYTRDFEKLLRCDLAVARRLSQVRLVDL